MTTGAPPLAALRGISKFFGATRALSEVSLELWPGEVHVLAGQNGAGKSTLLRILSGVYGADQGAVEVAGARRRFRGPADALRAGIAAIHQELSLVGAMSVADNLLLGEGGSAWGFIGGRRRRERALELLAALRLDVDPAQPLESLPLGTRQLIEIARALGRDARVLIMDEPTSALGEAEAERLFAQVRSLRERGCAILYISHRLEEIDRLADRITVLRDGRVVRTAAAAELGRDALVTTMVGRALGAEVAASAPAPADEVVLRAEGLRVTGPWGRALVQEISLAVAAGEIVGLSGLEGSGAALLPYALFGAVPATGKIEIDGKRLLRPSPGRSIARGMLLASGDRAQSLIASLSVRHNASLSCLRQLSPHGWMRLETERAAVATLVARLAIDCPSIEAPVGQLSGGNQQKVALARALLAEPRVLLLDEPTRGIDVGAKRDVYALVRKEAARGVAILLVSSEIDELVALCQRVLVIRRGRLVAELQRPALSRERILRAALGHEEAA